MTVSSALLLLVASCAVASAGGWDDHGKPPVPTKPAPPTPTKPAHGKGDPIFNGFDGRQFEFFGKAGRTYNVLSEKTHQVSMQLKAGKMWDHEGTYMEAVGFKYLDHTVELAHEGDALTVTLDGEKLAMRPQQTEQEVLLGLAQGEMQLLWQLHRPDTGNAVEITTELLQMVCWVTPAGTRDEGGVVQPAYLNFELSLLAAPAGNAMEGILGGTYLAAPRAEDDFKFHGVDADYEVPALFDTAHPKSLFGKTARATKARKLIDVSAPVAFPLSAAYMA